jgi:hypothetical protein
MALVLAWGSLEEKTGHLNSLISAYVIRIPDSSKDPMRPLPPKLFTVTLPTLPYFVGIREKEPPPHSHPEL